MGRTGWKAGESPQAGLAAAAAAAVSNPAAAAPPTASSFPAPGAPSMMVNCKWVISSP